MGVSIASIAYYLPENLVNNEQLLELVQHKGGSLANLTKLKERLELNQAERRYFKNASETGASMAEQAAKKCLAKINFAPHEVDCILYVGMLRDYIEPAMAIILQDVLGAGQAHAFDLANACNSFLNGMEIAEMYIKNGKYRNVLLVGAENGSERIPWEVFNSETNQAGFSALTISDGAAAMLLQADTAHQNSPEFRFKTYGQYHDLCKIKIGKKKPT